MFVAKISLDRIVGYLLPFVLVVIGCLMLVTYLPSISLSLRDLVFDKAAVTAPGSAPATVIAPQ